MSIEQNAEIVEAINHINDNSEAVVVVDRRERHHSIYKDYRNGEFHSVAFDDAGRVFFRSPTMKKRSDAKEAAFKALR